MSSRANMNVSWSDASIETMQSLISASEKHHKYKKRSYTAMVKGT